MRNDHRKAERNRQVSSIQYKEKPFVAFDSSDIDRARKEWRCNCGPAALAACLGWTPDAVRPHLGDFETRGYTNVSLMEKAIGSTGFRFATISTCRFPTHGLARVQWGGPWLKPGVSPRAACIYTHWVASKVLTLGNGLWIFDVNSGWTTGDTWKQETVPKIIESVKRADGTWKLTHSWEVRKPRRPFT